MSGDMTTLRKTTTNVFTLSSASGSNNKPRRSSKGSGVGSGTDIGKSDYSGSLESDDHNVCTTGSDKDDDTSEKGQKKTKNKKQKKLSNEEIRETLEKNAIMINGLQNTFLTIVKQNNEFNRRMKILEQESKIQNNNDLLVSGEDETCSINNLIAFITWS